MKKKHIKSILLATFLVLIICAVVFGTTFAFFSASSDSNNIVGSTYNANFGVEVYEIKKSTSLMPVNDNLITNLISKTNNQCVDNNGQEVCSLYKLDVINSGEELELHGFIRTSNSTYTSNNLKFMVYTKNGNSYTPATDALTITHNSGDTMYFKNNNSNYITNINDGRVSTQTISYYIVFWISEINESQNDDQGKIYSCMLGFESIHGDKLTTSFDIST